MAKPRLPWGDALRILRKRRDLVGGLSEPQLTDSIQAFLAWKAFAIVARGITPEAREKNQCQELMRITLPMSALRNPALRFVRGLEALIEQSPALMSDWYCEEDWDASAKTRRVEEARRRVRRTSKSMKAGDGLQSPSTAYDIGEDMYAVRSAVIAHASVHTGGNLFPHLVPPFGSLAALSACAGIAIRASVELDSVLEDADVDLSA